uniref:Uncharacterized protein n=1 Tax=Vitis vinifera TaxID=29760 RepID=F6HA03_VITVI
MEMEREGFEPSIRITRTTDWQSAALVHSTISPIHKISTTFINNSNSIK